MGRHQCGRWHCLVHRQRQPGKRRSGNGGRGWSGGRQLRDAGSLCAGGAGAIIRSGRAARKIDDLVDASRATDATAVRGATVATRKAFGGLSHASRYGIQPYSQLTSLAPIIELDGRRRSVVEPANRSPNEKVLPQRDQTIRCQLPALRRPASRARRRIRRAKPHRVQPQTLVRETT